MKSFSWLADFAANNKIKLTHKGAIAIILITVVLLLDSYLGISFHYRTKNKLNEIESVNSLLQNKDLDSTSRQYILLLRDEIIYKRSAIDYFLGRTSLNSKTLTANEPIKNNAVFFISKWVIFIFLGCMLFFTLLFDKYTEASVVDRLGTALFYLLFSLSSGFIVAQLLNFIPLIGGNWFYNYLTNLLVQFVVIVAGFTLNNRLMKFERDKEFSKLQETIEQFKKELESHNRTLSQKEIKEDKISN